jgi:hypothetical protein
MTIQEAKTRNLVARGVLAAVAESIPQLSRQWECLYAALCDTPVLISEVIDLRAEIEELYLHWADLAAAARAALFACRDGEPDPLSYLRDEMEGQGWIDGSQL